MSLPGDSLAGAIAAAADFPAFIEIARLAFLDGFHTVAIITGAILALVAAVAFVMFRKLPPLGASQPEAAAAEPAELDSLPAPAE
jgi:hypothetical protein